MPQDASSVPASRVAVRRSLILLVNDLQKLQRQHLWLQVIVAMIVGIGIGVLLAPGTGLVEEDLGAEIGGWLALPGNLFLGAIKFVVVPLVLASVVRGIAVGDHPELVSTIASRTVLFFLVTTLAAVAIGLAVSWTIQPGRYIDSGFIQQALGGSRLDETTGGGGFEFDLNLPGRIAGVVPTNIYAALAEGDMLRIVIGAVILGVAMVMVPREQARPILDLLGGIQAACMVIVRWIMRFAPLAVLGLLADLAQRVGIDAIIGLAAYVGTVVLGLVLLLGVYLVVVAVVANHTPLAFLMEIKGAMLMAFSTSSSAAVMPLTLKTAEDNLNVRDTVSRFVVPIGTTVNMAATALYQTVAVVFIAQVFGVEMPLGSMLLIMGLAVTAAIGSPGTPGVGIVILASVLESAGLPGTGLALILGVDRMLDMCRTSVNVVGDLAACVAVDHAVPHPDEMDSSF